MATHYEHDRTDGEGPFYSIGECIGHAVDVLDERRAVTGKPQEAVHTAILG